MVGRPLLRADEAITQQKIKVCRRRYVLIWLHLFCCRPHLSLPNLAVSGLTSCLQDIMVGLECAEQRQSLQVTCCQHAPRPALGAVSSYCCTCLCLSEQAPPSQKDLQLQAVHTVGLFLSGQG